MLRRSHKNLLLFFSIVLSLIFLLVISLVILLSTLFLFKDNDKTDSPPRNYELTEINSLKGITRHGFVKINQELTQKEYLTYQNTEGSFFIITNHGGKEYECHGRCYCSSSETKRRLSQSSLAQRGLTILLSAFSLSMATKIAEEAFRDQCFKKLEEEEEECITSGVARDYGSDEDEAFFDEVFEGVIKDFVEEDDLLDQSVDEKGFTDAVVNEVDHCLEKFGEFEEDDEFECSGFCIQNDAIAGEDLKEYVDAGQNQFGDCTGLTIKKTFSPKESMLKNDEERLYVNLNMKKIRMIFLEEYLISFCEESSKINMEMDIEMEDEDGLVDIDSLKRVMSSSSDLSFCIGGDDEMMDAGIANVDCVHKMKDTAYYAQKFTELNDNFGN